MTGNICDRNPGFQTKGRAWAGEAREGLMKGMGMSHDGRMADGILQDCREEGEGGSAKTFISPTR